MPFNLLILPLIGGYIFVESCTRFRYRTLRLDKERLIFRAALAGTFFLLTAYLGRAVIQHYWPTLPDRWAGLVPFPYSGTTFAAFLIGAVGWWPLNRFCVWLSKNGDLTPFGPPYRWLQNIGNWSPFKLLSTRFSRIGTWTPFGFRRNKWLKLGSWTPFEPPYRWLQNINDRLLEWKPIKKYEGMAKYWSDADLQVNQLIDEDKHPLEMLFHDSMKNKFPILVTLTDGKVYIGVVASSLNPTLGMKSFQLTLLKSGFRNTEDQRIILTTHYDARLRYWNETIDRITTELRTKVRESEAGKREYKDVPLEKDELEKTNWVDELKERVKGLKVVIPVDQLRSASRYYDEFDAGANETPEPEATPKPIETPSPRKPYAELPDYLL